MRAVTPGGALGAPGDPLHAQALAPAALAAPSGTCGEVGTNQVVITWKAVAGTDLAGYIIERRAAASAPRWARLNTRLLAEHALSRHHRRPSGGSFEYRVTAVATDEGQSPPSAVLQVALVMPSRHRAPTCSRVSGADGHVQIRFAPAEPGGENRAGRAAALRLGGSGGARGRSSGERRRRHDHR